jgi:hypothetical protein
MALNLKMAAKNRCFRHKSPKILYFCFLFFGKPYLMEEMFSERFKLADPIQNGRQISWFAFHIGIIWKNILSFQYKMAPLIQDGVSKWFAAITSRIFTFF